MRTAEQHGRVCVYLLIHVVKLIFFHLFLKHLRNCCLFFLSYLPLFCDCSLFQTGLEFAMKIIACYKFTQPYLLKKKQREEGGREVRLTKQINIKK